MEEREGFRIDFPVNMRDVDLMIVVCDHFVRTYPESPFAEAYKQLAQRFRAARGLLERRERT